MLGKYILGLAIIMLGVLFLSSYGENRDYRELSAQQSQAISGLESCKKYCDGPNWCNQTDISCDFEGSDDTCNEEPRYCADATVFCKNSRDYLPKTSCVTVPGEGADCGGARNEQCYRKFRCYCVDPITLIAGCWCPTYNGTKDEPFVDGCQS